MTSSSGDQPNHDIGTAVRARRQQLRLTQQNVADLAGCNLDFVSDLERGKPTARLDKIVSVLAVLGLKLKVVDA